MGGTINRGAAERAAFLSRHPEIVSFRAQIHQGGRAKHLQQLLDEKGLERSKVVREAGLNDTFGYQIFKGTRKASRDKVLQLAFAMQLGLRETDRLLQEQEK